MKLIVLLICIIFSSAAPAQGIPLQGHYVCPPTLSCRLSDFEFVAAVGKTYLQGHLIADDNSVGDVMLEMTSTTEGTGNVVAHYSDNTDCSYPLSITLQKVEKGYKIVTNGPTTFPEKYDQCPRVGATLEINKPIYLDDANASSIDSVQHLALLNPKAQSSDSTLAGTWRLSKRYMNTCNPMNSTADPRILEKVQIECNERNGATAQIWREEKDPPAGSDGCFTVSPEKIKTPLVTVNFNTALECRNFISELQKNYKKQPCNPGICTQPVYTYESSLVFSKSSRKIISTDDLLNGNF